MAYLILIISMLYSLYMVLILVVRLFPVLSSVDSDGNYKYAVRKLITKAIANWNITTIYILCFAVIILNACICIGLFK